MPANTCLRAMDTLPALVFVVDTVKEAVAVAESNKMKIPVVGLCDTDADIDLIDYIIPGNDDAVRSIKLICSIVASAVLEGKATRESKQPAEAASVALKMSENELSKEIKLDEGKAAEETAKTEKAKGE